MNFSKKNLLALAVAASILSPLAQAAQTEQPRPPAAHGEHKAHGNPLKDAVVASWNLDEDELASLAQADSDFRAGLQQLRGDDGKTAPEQRRAAEGPPGAQLQARVLRVFEGRPEGVPPP